MPLVLQDLYRISHAALPYVRPLDAGGELVRYDISMLDIRD